MIIIYTLVGNLNEAREIAKELIVSKAAGCVNVIPNIESCCIWEGEFQHANETGLWIKTMPEKEEDVRSLLTQKHPYAVPAIVTMATENVNLPFLNWLKEQVE